MQAKVAIVLLNWNGRSFLETYLPSVMATTYSHHEVIVIDNASSDDSIQFLQTNYPTVRIIQNTENFGFAGGYNQGLKSVEATYFILLNTDVAVSPGWLEPMVELLENNPKIAACQPTLLQYNQPEYFEYAGAAGGWLDCLGYPFARGRVMDECELDSGQYDQTVPVFWASGAALFIRSSAFWEAGGFDNYFFAHQEEIDLCWRLQLLGHMIYACPSAKVFHLGGGTLPKGNPRKVYLNFRNNWIMLAKNLSVGKAVYTLIVRWCLDLFVIMQKIMGKEFEYARAVIKAHQGFFKWLLWDRSQSVWVEKKNKQWEGYYRGSLVWQYFVRGRKKFSEIILKKK